MEGENQSSWQKESSEKERESQQTQPTQPMYDAKPRTQTQDTLVRSDQYPAVITVLTCPSKVPLKTSLIHAFHRGNTKLNCLCSICVFA